MGECIVETRVAFRAWFSFLWYVPYIHYLNTARTGTPYLFLVFVCYYKCMYAHTAMTITTNKK